MPFPLHIHLLDMDSSDAVEGKIRERSSKLERFADLQRCDVWVSSPLEHHRKGKRYTVRILLTLPGGEIAIDFQPPEEDVYVAIRQAFDAARRRLQDIEKYRGGEAKAHPRAPENLSARRVVHSRRAPDTNDRKGAA